jgi:hypothetical protein
MDFNSTPEFELVRQEYKAFKAAMLLRGSEYVYDNALTIFATEQAYDALSNHMEYDDSTPTLTAAITMCATDGKGFLAELTEWVTEMKRYNFSDILDSVISVLFFAGEVNAGEWEFQ